MDAEIRRRNLDHMFKPASVALVGASDRSYLAKNVWASLTASGFEGRRYAVNPGRTEAFGGVCHPSIAALPEKVDLCLIAVSAQSVLGVTRECAEAEVPAAMLFTLFNSTAENARLRSQLVKYLAKTQMAVCGSGTFGISSPNAKFAVVMGGRPPKSAGRVALICQSGGIMNSIASCLDAANIGLEAAVATGGEDQLGAADFIEHLVRSGSPVAIGCIVEQIKDPHAFRSACEFAASRSVPVVVLYVGRSERGKQAAFAHSGSLATDTRVLDALLAQVGAISVANLTQMVSTLAVFASLDGRALGPKAGVVTISGGETGLAADMAERHGLVLPDLQADTDTALRDIFKTPDLGYGNPVDAAAGSLVVLGDAAAYGRCIEAVRMDKSLDVVIARHLERSVWEATPATEEPKGGAPVFWYARTAYDRASGTQNSFILSDIEEAFATLGRIARYHDPAPLLGSLEPVIEKAMTSFPKKSSGVLMEHEVFPFLTGTGLNTPRVWVFQPGEAVEPTLSGCSGPFIAKIVSDTIIHRRAAGGVIMNLNNARETVEAVEALFAKFGGSISGVLVEPMIRPDLELMLGARAGAMGLVIILGFGGTFVEDLETMALRLSPLREVDAVALIDCSKSAAALKRIAGDNASVAIEQLTRIVMHFDALCRSIGPELSEFDINPVGFFADRSEFTALDGKIVLTPQRNSDQ